MVAGDVFKLMSVPEYPGRTVVFIYFWKINRSIGKGKECNSMLSNNIQLLGKVSVAEYSAGPVFKHEQVKKRIQKDNYAYKDSCIECVIINKFCWCGTPCNGYTNSIHNE